MIPSNFKDILAHIENAGILQTLAMLIFIILFLITIDYVMIRPKKNYTNIKKAPLEDE